MKSKTISTTSLSIIMTVLMIGLISSPLVTKIYAANYNDYKSYGEDMSYNEYKEEYKEYMPYNGYKDYNKVKIFPPSGILTAKWWWQWITEIPREINPLLDETGENCDINQQGPVWFLVGTPGDTQSGDVITGSAERECTIPEGKKILIPIINAACLELTDEATIREILDIPEGQPIPEAQLEEGLRICVEDIIDQVNLLEFSIDGKEITNFEDFRVQSPLFTMTLREDNPFDIENAFPGIPQRSISDGYWVLVKGLEPGEHTIEFKGGIAGIFETEVTYHITIEPTNNNNYGSYTNNNGYNNNYYY